MNSHSYYVNCNVSGSVSSWSEIPEITTTQSDGTAWIKAPPSPIGYFEIGGACYPVYSEIRWIHRFMARLLLGWKYKPYVVSVYSAVPNNTKQLLLG